MPDMVILSFMTPWLCLPMGAGWLSEPGPSWKYSTWQMASHGPTGIRIGIDITITDLQLSRDGKQIYTVLNSNEGIRVWDAANGAILDEIWLPELDPGLYQSCSLYDDLAWPYFARNNCTSGTNLIELWNLEKHSYQELALPTAGISEILISGSGLLVANNEDVLYAWRASDGRLIAYASGNFVYRFLQISRPYPGTVSTWPVERYPPLAYSIFKRSPINWI